MRFKSLITKSCFVLLVISILIMCTSCSNPIKMDQITTEKDEIVIATIFGDKSELEKLAAEYNKQYDDREVIIKDYWDNNDINELEHSLTRLQTDCLGDNSPDIVDCDNLGIFLRNLAKDGYLADQTTYIENDTVLSIDDFYTKVLETGKYEESIYWIPQTFGMSTLVIPEEDFTGSWTFLDFMEYIDKYPEATVWMGNYSSNYTMWESCLLRNLTDSFVNMQDGENYFDSDEFKRLLAMAKERCSCDNSEEMAEYYSIDDKNAFARNKFENHEWLAGFYNVILLDAVARDVEMYGNAGKCVGFPTRSGKGYSILNADNGFAILKSSEKKDKAWDFIRYCILQTPEWGDYALYSYKPHMQSKIEKELSLYGQSEEVIKDEEGNVVEIRIGDHNVNEDAVSFIYDMLENSKPCSEHDEVLFDIVCEELDSFFNGEKDVDEVCDIIQSRVQLYVDENSRQ